MHVIQIEKYKFNTYSFLEMRRLKKFPRSEFILCGMGFEICRKAHVASMLRILRVNFLSLIYFELNDLQRNLVIFRGKNVCIYLYYIYFFKYHYDYVVEVHDK